MDHAKLADLLFPAVTETPADLEKLFPRRRAGTVATRIAPSPTGFLHIGTVFTAFVNERIAHGAGGTFYLRIEDTDDKREVENAARDILEGLKRFGIGFDEGAIGPDGADVGAYGPYTQSRRARFYHACAKDLVRRGLAYPCFLSEKELEDIRAAQQEAKQPLGVYGRYAANRELPMEEVEKKVAAGERYVLRLRVPDDEPVRVTVEDLIRGKVEIANAFQDVVLLKKNGIPTYHFAHCVDDHLMRTTHVIRADEWFPSLPLHLQLFRLMGWEAPKYAHISPLMKADGGSKRKISKRKDPEANVEWFFSKGYPTEGILEYLGNIANSGFEDWKRQDPSRGWDSFPFRLEDMNPAGALTDLVKMDGVCQEWVSRLPAGAFFARVREWAARYNPEFSALLEKHPDYASAALNIERGTPKDPKRYHKFEDAVAQTWAFFDENWPAAFEKGAAELPKENRAELRGFVSAALESCANPDETEEAWFAGMKAFGKEHKFAEGNAQFKEGGYVGKVGDAMGALRIGLLGSRVTPNLWHTLRAMGPERVRARLSKLAETLAA